VCDLETSRMGAPYIYDISHLRVKLGVGKISFIPKGVRSDGLFLLRSCNTFHCLDSYKKQF